MERINETLNAETVARAISNSSQNRSSVRCWRCLDVGVVLKDGFAHNCLCVRRKLTKAHLAAIPPIFNRPKLSTMRPRPDLHPAQASVITFVRAHPNDSYLLCGKNGTGKSHIAWAIYRHCLAQRRVAVACTVRDLLAEYRRVEVGVSEGETLKSPRVSAHDLRRSSKPWLLFLDEFEKARPSEFASEQLFSLLDAARAFNHQIVVTSNLSADRLREHWSRIDEIWGNSILTRLEGCHNVELF